MKRRRAFNLTELMVAMGFLTMAIFAVISVNVYSLRASEGARSRQVANLVASTQLAMAETYLKTDFHVDPSLINIARTKSTQYPDYDYQLEDVGYEDAAQNLRRIRVLVYWQQGGWQHTYELATTFYNY